MNKFIGMGRIARELDIRYTAINNTAVVSFPLAIERRFAKEGEEKQTDFINVVAWNKTAEFCSKFFQKGLRIGVVGRLQTRSYEDKDGKTVYVTEVVAEEVYFADGKKETSNSSTSPFAEHQPVTDSDLPF